MMRFHRAPPGVEEGGWIQNGWGGKPACWVHKRGVCGCPPPHPGVPTHCPQPLKGELEAPLLSKQAGRGAGRGVQV